MEFENIGHKCKTDESSPEFVSKIYEHIKRLDEFAYNKNYIRSNIVNIDETPLRPFEMLNYTWADKTQNNVDMKNRNNDKYRVSCVLAVTASGDKLPPCLIFHGSNTDRGRVINEIRSHPKFKSGDIYLCCNETAWLTKEVMLDYTNFLFGDEGFFCDNFDNILLVLDNFGGHNIAEEATKYNIDILWLPENSTHMTQPLDVSINRVFKLHFRNKITNILVERNMEKIPIKEARTIVIDVVCEVWYDMIQPQIVADSFICTGLYSHFDWVDYDFLNNRLQSALSKYKRESIHHEIESEDFEQDSEMEVMSDESEDN